MLYQPKFCSECGEKIVRAEWKFWHSRQFCDLCKTKHQVHDATGRYSVFIVPIVLIGLAASAFIPGRTVNQLQNTVPPAGSFVSEGKPKELEPRSADSTQPQIQTEQLKPEPLMPSPEQAAAPTKRTSEAVFFCGAPTKKGTACTRRVKTKGFCWQHKETAQ